MTRENSTENGESKLILKMCNKTGNYISFYEKSMEKANKEKSEANVKLCGDPSMHKIYRATSVL